MTVEQVLERLEGVTGGRGQWSAKCPSHDDKNPSLSIACRDGKVLLHCWGGCDTKDVVAALGLEMRDLFPPKRWGAAR
jgi:DNA primase